MIDKHKEFAEAMRKIMRNTEVEQKKAEPRYVDEETRRGCGQNSGLL